MDAAHSAEPAAGLVGDLYRRAASLQSLVRPRRHEHEMPSLAALVDAVYRFDIDAPVRARELPERR